MTWETEINRKRIFGLTAYRNIRLWSYTGMWNDGYSVDSTRLQRWCKCAWHNISIDIKINVSKSSCLRIGPRSNVPCTSICCSSGGSLPWVEDVRYIGVFMKRSRVFKYSLYYAKKSFYRAANANFRKDGRIASISVRRLQSFDIDLTPLDSR